MTKSGSLATNLVASRGNRCTATILGWLEENLYKDFPEIETQYQKRIRQLVLDNINGFKDLAIDIVKSDTEILNDEYVNKLGEIHMDIRKLRQSLEYDD